MKNLLERLKPELKDVLFKKYEKYPNTLKDITDILQNESYYTHVPYWVYSDLRFITKDAFGEHKEFFKEYFLSE